MPSMTPTPEQRDGHQADPGPDALPVGRQDLDAIEDTLATFRPPNPAIDSTGRRA